MLFIINTPQIQTLNCEARLSLLNLNKLQFSVQQLVELSKKYIGRFLLKGAINHFATLDKCTYNPLFFMEIFIRLPIFDPDDDKNFLNPAGLKDFFNTKIRQQLVNEIISTINLNTNLLVQKTTGLGATTTIITTALWYVLFKPDSRIVIVSQAYNSKKASSSATSIFYTLLAIYNQLIKILMVDVLRFDSSQNGIKYYTVENNYINSSIILLASTKPVDLTSFFPDINELTHKAIIFDEFAFHKHADPIWQTVENYPISKIVISSANGKSNLFYQLISAKTLPIHTMHWFDAPTKDQKWYENICKNNDPIWVEQYINIDYNFKYSTKKAAKPVNVDKTTTCKKQPQKINNQTNSCANQNPKRQYKPHRNPKNSTTPSAFNEAIIKYVSITTDKGNENNSPEENSDHFEILCQQALNKKQIITKTDPQIFTSLEIVIELAYGINEKEATPVQKPDFNIFKLPQNPLSPQKLTTLIHKFTARLSA